eukprot:SAG31_NODE_4687_length_3031_cov_1.632674_2_plen_92_part_00
MGGPPEGTGGDSDVLDTHADDHPSGKHHIMRAAASCFSFDAPAKHNRPMSTIHHSYVPGFYLHLQRGMNRLFAGMVPGKTWWRWAARQFFS